jgi:hypothetical protein
MRSLVVQPIVLRVQFSTYAWDISCIGELPVRGIEVALHVVDVGLQFVLTLVRLMGQFVLVDHVCFYLE